MSVLSSWCDSFSGLLQNIYQGQNQYPQSIYLMLSWHGTMYKSSCVGLCFSSTESSYVLIYKPRPFPWKVPPVIMLASKSSSCERSFATQTSLNEELVILERSLLRMTSNRQRKFITGVLTHTPLCWEASCGVAYPNCGNPYSLLHIDDVGSRGACKYP